MPQLAPHCGSLPATKVAAQKRHPLAMPSRQAQLQKDTHYRLMQLLQDKPTMSQRAMAKSLGISFGGVNYCLNALMAKGLVKVNNFSQNQNKFSYVYLLTPQGIAEKAALTASFLQRKMDEYDALKAEIAALTLEVNKADQRHKAR